MFCRPCRPCRLCRGVQSLLHASLHDHEIEVEDPEDAAAQAAPRLQDVVGQRGGRPRFADGGTGRRGHVPALALGVLGDGVAGDVEGLADGGEVGAFGPQTARVGPLLGTELGDEAHDDEGFRWAPRRLFGRPHLRNSRTVADVYLRSVALSNSNIRNVRNMRALQRFNTWVYLKPAIVTWVRGAGISGRERWWGNAGATAASSCQSRGSQKIGAAKPNMVAPIARSGLPKYKAGW